MHQCVVAKYSEGEKSVIRSKKQQFVDTLEDLHGEIILQLEEENLNPADREALRQELIRTFNWFRSDFDGDIDEMHQEGAQAGRELAVQRYDLGIDLELTRPEVSQILHARALQMSQQTRNRMVGDLTGAIGEAYDEGYSIPKITQTLQDEVFTDMRGYEAERIARTNVISGSNKGGIEAFRDSSAVGKEWLATGGRRTRTTHREANDQVVPIDKNFVVGGHECDHPGDPRLPVEELVNCRCRPIPIFDPELVPEIAT